MCAKVFTAQRSTRRTCSNACRQRAKRARKRAAQWDHLLPEARCQWCGGPRFPGETDSENERRALIALTHPRRSHTRKYCSPECRKAARKFRYRVAGLSDDSPYRVAGYPMSGDRYALAEAVPCLLSAEWHEMARVVLSLIERGGVLALPPALSDPFADPDVPVSRWRTFDLAAIREDMASHGSDRAPGDAHPDREAAGPETLPPAEREQIAAELLKGLP